MSNDVRPINPFKPTAGAEPPMLIGRDRVVDDFCDAMEEGVGAPGRLMRITGPRGSGKTVLLSELGEVARSYKWNVVDVTASGRLIDDIVHALESDDLRGDLSIEAGLGPVKVSASKGSAAGKTLRDELTEATRSLTKRHRGLFITVDEIQDASEDDVRQLASSVQHLIRERQNIAFAFAGLTTGVMDLINGKALTFLRRAMAEELAAIPIKEVASSMERTIEVAGLEIGGDVLDYVARQTSGYAYLIQLVGYRVFAVARRHASESHLVTMEDAERGCKEAMSEFAIAVQEPAIASLPERAIEYLLAMAQDEGNSHTRELAQRMGMDPTRLTSTRRQLINAQVIEAPSRGVVRFAIPHMRDYLLNSGEEILARY